MTVTTPAVNTVIAVCPECDESIEIDVDLITSLTVEDGERTLKVKSKSKAYAHVHGQLTIGGAVQEAIEGLQDLADESGSSIGITANGRTAILSPKAVAAARAELDLDGDD